MKQPTFKKQFASSVLLWMRKDIDRQKSMDRWKGPHAKIITAIPGSIEYRQVHFTAENKGLMPTIKGIETTITEDRRIDGIAEPTLEGIASVFKGRKEKQMAFNDEINLFRRTLLYATLPGNTRWYDVASGKPESYAVIFLQRKDGVSQHNVKKFIDKELAPTIAEMSDVRELRTEIFMKWNKALWNSPNVAHDNPEEAQFHAKITIGFESDHSKQMFFTQESLRPFIKRLQDNFSAIHAYDVSAVYTMVKDGKIIL